MRKDSASRACRVEPRQDSMGCDWTRCCESIFWLLFQSMDSTSEALTTDSLFQNAFEFAAIGMALVSPEGKWLRVNRAICEITGYSETELLERTFQDITHPDDLDLDLANVRKMLAGEIKTYQMEKRYFHKNGSIVWVLLSVSLVHNKSGAPLFFISQIQ